MSGRVAALGLVVGSLVAEAAGPGPVVVVWLLLLVVGCIVAWRRVRRADVL